MSIFQFLSALKKSLFPSKMMHLSSLLTFDFMSRNVMMRPVIEEQRQNMLNAYLKAVKTEFPNGGHIFVGSNHAHEVFHFLDAHQHEYTTNTLLAPGEHQALMPDVGKRSGVIRVFVEDDSLHEAVCHDRFVEVQKHFVRESMPSSVRLPQEEMSELRQFFLLYEIKHSFKYEMHIRMSQLRNRLSYCVISSEDYLKRKFDKPWDGMNAWEGHKHMLANTIQIYGSGAKHKDELLMMGDNGYTEEPVVSKKPVKRINIGRFFITATGSYGIVLNYDCATEVALDK